MDYLTVAQTASLTALIMTSILLVLLAFQSTRYKWRRFLILGVSGQILWSGVNFISYKTETISLLLLHVELLRLLLWLLMLVLLLHRRAHFSEWPPKAKVLALSILPIVSAGFFIAATNSSSVSLLRLILIALAILNLVFTEQVVRNLNTNRMVKLVGLCLTFLFAYDVVYFGQGLINSQVPPIMLQARFALAFALMTALATGSLVFNDQANSTYLFSVSRPAAFYSTAFTFSSLLIISIAIGSVYLDHNGYLGTYLFSLALLVTLFILFSLVISRTFRQNFEVFLSKHFFDLKYDYRNEWLKAIKLLSEIKPAQPDFYSRILELFTSAVRTSQGEIWICTGSTFVPVTDQILTECNSKTVSINDVFIKKMVKESWIFAPQTRSASLAQENSLLPEWLQKNDKIWVIAPVSIHMKLLGFVLLSAPRIETEITYEDRDLLTNISTQVASHLLIHEQEKVISGARQMETYNRLSAFIMHDMNNVIAQLSLIGRNAERHRDNPAFISDMIKTVRNATSRMQDLVQKFNPASKEKRALVRASDLISDLIAELIDYKPAPTLVITEDFQIDADRQKLTLAVKNIIRNAQEATKQDGKVSIEIGRIAGTPFIKITDDGLGMTDQFIREELFRPFSTTKDNGGVGIGAYLTKSYLEHLGAHLSVHSEVNIGTTFEIAFS